MWDANGSPVEHSDLDSKIHVLIRNKEFEMKCLKAANVYLETVMRISKGDDRNSIGDLDGLHQTILDLLNRAPSE